MRARLADLRAPLRFRDFRLIWGSQLASELGDWAGRLALAVLVEQQSHSPALVALVTSASVIPFLGPGQLLATALERLPRRHVVVLSDIVRGGVFILLALDPPTAVLLIGAFVAGTFSPPFEAARSALTASTVPAEHYGNAVAIASTTFQVSVLLGYGVGGVFIAAVGPRLALLLNAMSFAASALFLVRISVGRTALSTKEDPIRLRDGWNAIRGDQYIWVYVTTFSLLAACSVVAESLVASYAPEVLHEGRGTVAALAAAIPAGAIIGILLLRPRGTHQVVFRGALLMALTGSLLAAIFFAVGPEMPLTVACFAMVGVFNASIVPANEVTNLRLDERSRASSFSILVGAIVGSQALGAGVGGVVARSVGVRHAVVGAMTLAVVVSLIALMRIPRGRHAIVRQPEWITQAESGSVRPSG